MQNNYHFVFIGFYFILDWSFFSNRVTRRDFIHYRKLNLYLYIKHTVSGLRWVIPKRNLNLEVCGIDIYTWSIGDDDWPLQKTSSVWCIWVWLVQAKCSYPNFCYICSCVGNESKQYIKEFHNYIANKGVISHENLFFISIISIKLMSDFEAWVSCFYLLGM